MAAVFAWIGTAFTAVFTEAAVATIAQSVVVGAICGAVVGAVASAIQGGNIWKGALTGAIVGGVAFGVTAYAQGAEWGIGAGEAGTGTMGTEALGTEMGSTAIETGGGIQVEGGQVIGAPSGVGGAEVVAPGTPAATPSVTPTFSPATGVTVPAAESFGMPAPTTEGEGILGGLGKWAKENPVPAMIIGQSVSQGAGAILEGEKNKDAMELALEQSRMNIDANKIKDLTNLDLNVVMPTIDSLRTREEWKFSDSGVLGGA